MKRGGGGGFIFCEEEGEASFFALSSCFARPKLVRSPILGFPFAKNAQERLLRRLRVNLRAQ